MMKKLRFEIKSIGWGFIIPIVAITFAVVYMIILKVFNYESFKAYFTFELFIPVFSCWWSTFYLATVFEERSGQVLLTYPISTKKITLIYSLRYFLIYLFLVLISFLLLIIIFNEFSIKYLLLFVSQSIFYFSFAYAIMSFLYNSGWTIFLCFSYLFTEFLTRGQLLSLYNIHDFGSQAVSLNFLTVKTVLFSTILLILGQWNFIRKNKFKKLCTKTKDFSKGDNNE